MATPKAIAAAEKALSIDASLAEAHNSLAHAYFHELNWAAAEREFKRGIALNPSCATVHFYYANYLVAVGRFEEALAEARWAQSLDPRSLAAEENVARILYQAGQYEQAIARSLEVLESNPTFAHACETLGYAYEEQGRYKDAIAAFQKAIASSARAPRYLADLARAHAFAGQEREARKLLQELKQVSKTKFVPSYLFTWVYVGLGDKDEALAWLTRDTREQSNALPFLKTSPRFAPLRPDPRFQKLVRDLGFPS
jgi:tetratricopeptide (TPR) repeat protein